MPHDKHIAVIGAGIAGLAAAHRLAELGAAVRLFDKGRGPGGRLSTRRIDTPPLQFDHGAQYFTAREAPFLSRVADWSSRGVCAIWTSRLVALTRGAITAEKSDQTRYVGTPGMNAIVRDLVSTLPAGCVVDFGTTVRALDVLPDDSVALSAVERPIEGSFDAAVVAVPAPQAATLLAAAAPELGGLARSSVMNPTWALMVGFDRRIPVEFDGAFVSDSAISWIARNNAKPGRPAAETWVAHASTAWSQANLELTPEQVAPLLLAELSSALRVEGLSPTYLAAHRWRFAHPASEPLASLTDAASPLAICGDWTTGPRIESAYLSGLRAAGDLATRLGLG